MEGTARASHKGLQMLGHPGIPVKENFQPLSGQEFVERKKNGDQDHPPWAFKLTNKEASEVHTIDLITTKNFPFLSMWLPCTSWLDMKTRKSQKLVAVLCMDWITRTGNCAEALLMRFKSSMTEIFKLYSKIIIFDWLVYNRSKWEKKIYKRNVLPIILKCWNKYN